MSKRYDTIDDVKVGDRVVANDKTLDPHNPANSLLEEGKVYTIGAVHKRGSGGTISLLEAFNDKAPDDWAAGSFGYLAVDRAPEPPSVEEASDEDLINELRGRGWAGTLTKMVPAEVTL